jgi:hypothetical protein
MFGFISRQSRRGEEAERVEKLHDPCFIPSLTLSQFPKIARHDIPLPKLKPLDWISHPNIPSIGSISKQLSSGGNWEGTRKELAKRIPRNEW